MRKGAAAIAVARRPDARDIRLQPIVGLDVAARIDRDAALVQVQIVGIRTPPDGQQQMAADDLRLALAAAETDRDAVGVMGEMDALGARADSDALAFEDRAGGIRDVRVLASDQPRSFFDDRHPRPEPRVDLREFEPDVAAAHHH